MSDASKRPIAYKPTAGLSYDPEEPKYWDPMGLAAEIECIFEICHGRRLCFKYCDSFPSLFSLIDERHGGDVREITAGETGAVLDDCFQCSARCNVRTRRATDTSSSSTFRRSSTVRGRSGRRARVSVCATGRRRQRVVDRLPLAALQFLEAWYGLPEHLYLRLGVGTRIPAHFDERQREEGRSRRWAGAGIAERDLLRAQEQAVGLLADGLAEQIAATGGKLASSARDAERSTRLSAGGSLADAHREVAARARRSVTEVEADVADLLGDLAERHESMANELRGV